MNIEINIEDVILKGPRIILRAWNLNDLDDLYEYATMEDCTSRAGWMKIKNIDDAKFFLDHFINDKNTFAIEYQNKVIGNLSIHEYTDVIHPELNKYKGRAFGFVLNKHYWGQGIIPEALKLVIDYLFNDLNLDFILAERYANNLQCENVLLKVGFKRYDNPLFKPRHQVNTNLIEYILVNKHNK